LEYLLRDTFDFTLVEVFISGWTIFCMVWVQCQTYFRLLEFMLRGSDRMTLMVPSSL